MSSQMLSNQVSFCPSGVTAPAGITNVIAASASAASRFASFFMIAILHPENKTQSLRAPR